MKTLIFLLAAVSFFSCTKSNNDPCTDPSLINHQAICPAVYDPVCGCDEVTYANSCIAVNGHGLKSFTSGPCNEDCLPIQTETWSDTTFKDPVHIDTAYVEGDCLKIKFWYGGGCGEHDFRLTNQNFCFTPPVPPHMLLLEHRNNGDLCQALLSKEMSFQLHQLPANNDNGDVEIVLTDGSGKFWYFTYSIRLFPS